MNENKVASCIELVKGLHVCEDDVKAMNLRVLLANTNLREDILAAAPQNVLSWLDGNCSGLTEDEVLRLRTIIMKVTDDSTWFDPDNLGESQKS